MSFEIVAHKSGLVGHGDGFIMYGRYVTEQVYAAITRIIENNCMTSEFYKTRKECGAFFQGGSHDDKGRYVFVEFLNNASGEAVKEFMRLVNQEVKPHIGSDLTKIEIWPNTEGAYYYITEIAKETECSYNSGCSVSPVEFLPENNDTHNKVMALCRQMGLTIVNKP